MVNKQALEISFLFHLDYHFTFKNYSVYYLVLIVEFRCEIMGIYLENQ